MSNQLIDEIKNAIRRNQQLFNVDEVMILLHEIERLHNLLEQIHTQLDEGEPE